jgi:hypothetical protein
MHGRGAQGHRPMRAQTIREGWTTWPLYGGLCVVECAVSLHKNHWDEPDSIIYIAMQVLRVNSIDSICSCHLAIYSDRTILNVTSRPNGAVEMV